MANRGITMAASATRRAPNAFNLIRQVEVLQRAGHGSVTQQFKDWENVSAVSRAFNIGRSEAAAASNLQSRVDPSVTTSLKAAVAMRGLRSFITHDLIAKGTFNDGFTSGQGATEPWTQELTNGLDHRLVELFVRRICADWDRTPKNMQKALGYKEALTVHIACGMYQHYLECLRKRCPATEYPAIASKLETMFMSGLMDPDLVSSAENNVPPGDVCSVSQFRIHINMFEARMASEAEERSREAAAKVDAATFEQIDAQLTADLELLRAKMPKPVSQAVATAQDMKYCKDRQRYVICVIDATLWSGDTIPEALNKLGTLVSMSSCHLGVVQLPVLHASTSLGATLKHTRRIQDILLQADLDFSTSLTMTYTRDNALRSNSDKRPVTQSCALVTGGKASTSKWAESECFQGIFGPLPLIPVSEMQGYDPDNKPAPAYAEYGRACVRRLLEGETRPKLSYYGMFRKDQKQVVANIEGEIFEHWDGLPTSPPKTRPRDPAPHLTAIAGLSLMSLDSVGQPGWPDHVLNKFKADSEHRRKLEKMKADFLQEFKVPAQAKASVSRGPVRVTGAPDFTVDSAEPLDVNRVVDLEKVAPPDSEKRLATITGRSGKASIVVDTEMNIFIGNEVSDSLELCGAELFGFNTGNFEVKLVDSDKRHTSGIAWRFVSDLELVAENKVLMPICSYLHRLASSKGLADVTIPEHVITPKMHAAVS
ncbi:unnamed protein product [Durusdinium trenchii]|uniref:Uncharacterized protein n=1 Tax=Durusdinium trenchii TaxID=1381693 RepID=A0ABP0IGR5_9DINO